jgi:hypothetical protein
MGDTRLTEHSEEALCALETEKRCEQANDVRLAARRERTICDLSSELAPALGYPMA